MTLLIDSETLVEFENHLIDIYNVLTNHDMSESINYSLVSLERSIADRKLDGTNINADPNGKNDNRV